MGQELRILRRLPVGVEIGKVCGECLRIGGRGGFVDVVVGARDAEEIRIADGEVGQVVGVGEGGDELELECKSRIRQGGRLRRWLHVGVRLERSRLEG